MLRGPEDLGEVWDVDRNGLLRDSNNLNSIRSDKQRLNPLRGWQRKSHQCQLRTRVSNPLSLMVNSEVWLRISWPHWLMGNLSHQRGRMTILRLLVSRKIGFVVWLFVCLSFLSLKYKAVRFAVSWIFISFLLHGGQEKLKGFWATPIYFCKYSIC